MRRPRRTHSPKFKAKVALAALRGDKTLTELAEQCDLHPIQISEWKNQLAKSAGLVFSKGKLNRPGFCSHFQALKSKAMGRCYAWRKIPRGIPDRSGEAGH